MNKIVLIGNVGGDPTMRQTDSGVMVSNFTVATSEKWKDKAGNKQEKTEWHNIVCWNALAKNCYDHLKKGRSVAIEGKVQHRKYEKDGVKHNITEVNATNIEFLGSAKEKPSTKPTENTTGLAKAFTANDIPF